MASPFAPYANITVRFDLPSAEPTINADGNPDAETTPLIAIAYAKRELKNSQKAMFADQLPQYGADVVRTFYGNGFWVLPLQKPQLLLPGQSGRAYIWRIGGGFRLPEAGFTDEAEYDSFLTTNAAQIVGDGDFVLLNNPPDQFGVEAQTGDRFGGHLLTHTVWGDAA